MFHGFSFTAIFEHYFFSIQPVCLGRLKSILRYNYDSLQKGAFYTEASQVHLEMTQSVPSKKK